MSRVPAAASALLAVIALLVVMMPACTVFAQDDEPTMVDARLETYGTREKPVTVALSQGNTSMTWLLLVVLGAIAVGVMFKHTKRSHLD